MQSIPLCKESICNEREQNSVVELKRQIAGSFGAHASDYDQHAAFQRICGDRLLSSLDDQPRDLAVDLGCGTGYFLPALNRVASAVVALDLSRQMLIQAKQGYAKQNSFCVADIESLPFSDAAFDLGFSNLVMQWCSDLPATLSETYRALKPGGSLLFSILLDGSLSELKTSWQTIDSFSHVNKFTCPDELDRVLRGSPFSSYHLNQDSVIMRYQSFRQIRQDLKGIGANLVLNNRRRQTLTRKQVAQLNHAYEAFRLADGSLPATYQVAWVELRK